VSTSFWYVVRVSWGLIIIKSQLDYVFLSSLCLTPLLPVHCPESLPRNCGGTMSQARRITSFPPPHCRYPFFFPLVLLQTWILSCPNFVSPRLLAFPIQAPTLYAVLTTKLTTSTPTLGTPHLSFRNAVEACFHPCGFPYDIVDNPQRCSSSSSFS